MKSILVGTDLSARSDRALDRAVILARDLGVRLTIVHVVDDDLPQSIAATQQEAAKRIIGDYLKSNSVHEGSTVSIEIVLGQAYSDLLEMAEKVEADLIVLGIHREDRFKEIMDLFRGTTAERIIRASKIPVLSVKDRAGDPYHRILVAVDFSAYSRRAVEFAVEFAPNAEFHILHAYGVPFEGFLFGRATRSEVRDHLRREFEQTVEADMAALLAGQMAKDTKFARIICEGEVRSVIRQEAHRLEADLLVVGTHGRTGVTHAVLGSVAEDMFRDPPCDVLAIKAW